MSANMSYLPWLHVFFANRLRSELFGAIQDIFFNNFESNASKNISPLSTVLSSPLVMLVSELIYITNGMVLSLKNRKHNTDYTLIRFIAFCVLADTSLLCSDLHKLVLLGYFISPCKGLYLWVTPSSPLFLKCYYGQPQFEKLHFPFQFSVCQRLIPPSLLMSVSLLTTTPKLGLFHLSPSLRAKTAHHVRKILFQLSRSQCHKRISSILKFVEWFQSTGNCSRSRKFFELKST